MGRPPDALGDTSLYRCVAMPKEQCAESQSSDEITLGAQTGCSSDEPMPRRAEAGTQETGRCHSVLRGFPRSIALRLGGGSVSLDFDLHRCG